LINAVFNSVNTVNNSSYPQAELDQLLNTSSLWISRLLSKWSALLALDLMNYFSRNLGRVCVIGGPKVQQ